MKHLFNTFQLSLNLKNSRLVDILDQTQNRGKAMEEYTFWPDVHEGLRTMYMRTHFAIDEGGFFPAVKVSKMECYATPWRLWRVSRILYIFLQNPPILRISTLSLYLQGFFLFLPLQPWACTLEGPRACLRDCNECTH